MFGEFAATLESTTKPFPCIFGIAGFRTGQLRFAFSETLDAKTLATSLAQYLKSARQFVQNTSLAVFSSEIPRKLDDPLWEFCFAGEPVLSSVIPCTCFAAKPQGVKLYADIPAEMGV